MTFVTFLNELSFPEGQVSEGDATTAVVGLVRTLKALKAIHSDTALHSSVRIADVPLGVEKWLGPVMSAGEARDDWRYIRAFQNRAPFTVGIGEAFGMETEYLYCGRAAEGLGLSHALGTLAVSFPYPDWMASSLDIQRLHLGVEEKIDEESVIVVHAADPEHITINRDWIVAAPLACVEDGRELWRRRSEIFPHLKFLPRVEDQLKAFKAGDVLLQSAGAALMDLEIAVAEWETSEQNSPPFRTKVTPEGETRSRLFEFKDLAGVDRSFDMHSRYTPGAGRIHFWCDRSDGTATIAHVGEKVPD